MKSKTPREVLTQFYLDNNLELDGGQSSKHVKIDVSKKFSFYFPNFNARRKAVIKHDIHHLLTGYSASSLIGESEISAWEIASGCKSYWAAFLIDTSGIMIGVPLNSVKVLKAFARGRRTKNLYHDMFSTDEAMDMQIEELQRKLQLDLHTKDTNPTFSDVVAFLGFLLFGGIYSILSLIFLPFVVFYTLYCRVVE